MPPPCLGRTGLAVATVAGIVVAADNDAFWRPPAGGLSCANGEARELNKPVFIMQVGCTF